MANELILTKLISCLPIQLEKVPLLKKTGIKPDKITIYLEEVRGGPQGTAHSSSNWSTLHGDFCRLQKYKYLGWSRRLKFSQKRKRVEEPGKIGKKPVDAEGVKLVCRWFWDDQCFSSHFHSSLQLGESSLKLNISVEQDVEVQNLKAATVHIYDYYKPGEISLTLV